MQDNGKYRIMGIDFGEKRIGVALSDELHLLASPLEIIRRTTDQAALARLKQLIDQWQVTKLVIGLPLNMDGSYGHLAPRVFSFVDKLQKTAPLPLHWIDERLSSWEAEDSARIPRITPKGRLIRQDVDLDARAAAIILQRYLNGEKSASP